MLGAGASRLYRTAELLFRESKNDGIVPSLGFRLPNSVVIVIVAKIYDYDAFVLPMAVTEAAFMEVQFYIVAFRRTSSIQRRQPMLSLSSQILLLPFNQNLMGDHGFPLALTMMGSAKASFETEQSERKCC